jgi:hypothetical protein
MTAATPFAAAITTLTTSDLTTSLVVPAIT